MDSLGLYDIYEYAYLPWWQSFAGKISIAVLLSICFAAVVYFLVRRLRTRTKNVWEIWDTTITMLRTTHMNNIAFYNTLSTLIKECSVQMLNAPVGATDIELAAFLKAEKFSEPIRVMGATLERSHHYKYDPFFHDAAMGSREKELVYMHEALAVIKQMVTKQ